MANDSKDLFLQVPVQIPFNDSFEILNENDMKDFSFGGESFYLVMADVNRQAVNESLSTSLVLPVDTKLALQNLLSDSANDDDLYVKNNPACKESFTNDANEVFNVSEERIELVSNRTFDMKGFQKAFESQGDLLNSNYDKATSCKNYVERESKHTSLVKKAEIVALERNSGSLNKTFDAEITVEGKTEFTSRLQYSSQNRSSCRHNCH